MREKEAVRGSQIKKIKKRRSAWRREREVRVCERGWRERGRGRDPLLLTNLSYY